MPGDGDGAYSREDERVREKMKECVWVRPQLVAEIEFLEWSVLQKCTDEGVNMT